MAKNCSFDIVSNVDLQEVKNAVNQAVMEIRQRFDFKGSKSEITLDEKIPALNLVSDDEHKMKSVVDILEGKLIKRKVSLKALSYGAGGNRRWEYGSPGDSTATGNSPGEGKGNR